MYDYDMWPVPLPVYPIISNFYFYIVYIAI